MIRKVNKLARGMVGFGITTGVGSAVVGKIGGSTAAPMQSALGDMASYTPLMTSIGMGNILMGSIKPKKRSR